MASAGEVDSVVGPRALESEETVREGCVGLHALVGVAAGWVGGCVWPGTGRGGPGAALWEGSRGGKMTGASSHTVPQPG